MTKTILTVFETRCIMTPSKRNKSWAKNPVLPVAVWLEVGTENKYYFLNVFSWFLCVILHNNS